MRSPSILHSIVTIFLTLSFIIPVGAVQNQTPTARPAPAKNALEANGWTESQIKDLHLAAGEMAMDPVLKEIGSDTSTDLTINIKAGDPMLDEDPFFLGHQSWTKGSNKTEGVLVRKSSGSIDILPAKSNAMLQLRLPLEPVFQTTNYLFLSARSDNNLFVRKGMKLDEGLFIIEINELQSGAYDHSRIPIYFSQCQEMDG